MSAKKVYVVSGAEYFTDSEELFQDNVRVFTSREMAIEDIAARVLSDLAVYANDGAVEIECEEFERCVEWNHGRAGWNIDAIDIE